MTGSDSRPPRLAITKAFKDGTLTMRLSGVADTPEAPGLLQALKQATAELEQQGGQTIELDVRAVPFLNSTCLKSFVAWLVAAEESEAAFSVRFISTEEHFWQGRSIESLRHLAPGRVLQ